MPTERRCWWGTCAGRGGLRPNPGIGFRTLAIWSGAAVVRLPRMLSRGLSRGLSGNSPHLAKYAFASLLVVTSGE